MPVFSTQPTCLLFPRGLVFLIPLTAGKLLKRASFSFREVARTDTSLELKTHPQSLGFLLWIPWTVFPEPELS
jgi:hypothetical protein